MSANILIYSNDPTLLLTRRLILQKSGFNVIGTSEFDDAITLTINGQVDLLILCRTLRQQESLAVLETARGVNPAMKKIILDSTVAPCHLLENEEVVEDFLDHEMLVMTVSDTLIAQPA